jgi:Ca2+-binding RTX toxin-like protein
MSTHHITSDTTLGLNISSDNDTWIIETGVTVSGSAEATVDVSPIAEGNTVIVKGTIDSASHSGLMSNGLNTSVVIAATGTVNADYAGLEMQERGADVTNNGSIIANSIGVDFSRGDFTFANHGNINASAGYGIELDQSSHGHLVNAADGVVSGHISGLFVENGPKAIMHFENDGVLTGGNFSIFSTGGREFITNAGALDGNVSLGGGDDVLDSRNGNISGNVDLGGGDDRFDFRDGTLKPGAGDSVAQVFGGSGDDTYLIGKGNFTIAEAANNGNDTVVSDRSYTLADNIETLQLSGNNNIDGDGNNGFNILSGNAGNNHLSGHAGFDELAGGRGNDILTGGSGGDTFSFAPSGGHDHITDFASAEDSISLAGFGIASFNDLKNHHMDNVGADLVITLGSDTLTLDHTHIADVSGSDFFL